MEDLRILIREIILLNEAPRRKQAEDKNIDLTSKPWWEIVDLIGQLSPADRKELLSDSQGNYVIVHPPQSKKRDPDLDLEVKSGLDMFADTFYGPRSKMLSMSRRVAEIDGLWDKYFTSAGKDRLAVLTLKNMLKKDQEKASFAGKISAKKAEGPKDGPLGQIAFGEERVDNVPPEPDTRLEKDLLQSIDYYIGNHLRMQFEPDQVETIRSVIRAGDYKKIFVPASGKVYRGLVMSKRDFLKMYPQLEKKLEAAAQSRNALNVKINDTLVPRRADGASSWTTDMSVAREFGSSSRGEGSVAVVYTADAEKNTGSLFDLSNLYRLVRIPNATRRQNESEVLGFGPIKFSHITVYP